MVLPYLKKRTNKKESKQKQEIDEENEDSIIHNDTGIKSKQKKFQNQQKNIQEILNQALFKVDDIFCLDLNENENIQENGYFINKLESESRSQNDENWYSIFKILLDSTLNLSVVLLNKDFILDTIFEYYEKFDYMRENLLKIIIFLLRDLGDEIFDQIVQEKLNVLISTIKEDDYKQIQMVLQLIISIIRFCKVKVEQNMVQFVQKLINLIETNKLSYQLIKIFVFPLNYLVWSSGNQQDQRNSFINVLQILLNKEIVFENFNYKTLSEFLMQIFHDNKSLFNQDQFDLFQVFLEQIIQNQIPHQNEESFIILTVEMFVSFYKSFYKYWEFNQKQENQTKINVFSFINLAIQLSQQNNHCVLLEKILIEITWELICFQKGILLQKINMLDFIPKLYKQNNVERIKILTLIYQQNLELLNHLFIDEIIPFVFNTEEQKIIQQFQNLQEKTILQIIQLLIINQETWILQLFVINCFNQNLEIQQYDFIKNICLQNQIYKFLLLIVPHYQNLNSQGTKDEQDVQLLNIYDSKNQITKQCFKSNNINNSDQQNNEIIQIYISDFSYQLKLQKIAEITNYNLDNIFKVKIITKILNQICIQKSNIQYVKNTMTNFIMFSVFNSHLQELDLLINLYLEYFLDKSLKKSFYQALVLIKEIKEMYPNLQTEKDLIIKLQKMEQIVIKKQLQDYQLQIVYSFLLGYLNIKYSKLTIHTQKCLVQIMIINKQLFLFTFQVLLEQHQDQFSNDQQLFIKSLKSLLADNKICQEYQNDIYEIFKSNCHLFKSWILNKENNQLRPICQLYEFFIDCFINFDQKCLNKKEVDLLCLNAVPYLPQQTSLKVSLFLLRWNQISFNNYKEIINQLYQPEQFKEVILQINTQSFNQEENESIYPVIIQIITWIYFQQRISNKLLRKSIKKQVLEFVMKQSMQNQQRIIEHFLESQFFTEKSLQNYETNYLKISSFLQDLVQQFQMLLFNNKQISRILIQMFINIQREKQLENCNQKIIKKIYQILFQTLVHLFSNYQIELYNEQKEFLQTINYQIEKIKEGSLNVLLLKFIEGFFKFESIKLDFLTNHSYVIDNLFIGFKFDLETKYKNIILEIINKILYNQDEQTQIISSQGKQFLLTKSFLMQQIFIQQINNKVKITLEKYDNILNLIFESEEEISQQFCDQFFLILINKFDSGKINKFYEMDLNGLDFNNTYNQKIKKNFFVISNYLVKIIPYKKDIDFFLQKKLINFFSQIKCQHILQQGIKIFQSVINSGFSQLTHSLSTIIHILQPRTKTVSIIDNESIYNNLNKLIQNKEFSFDRINIEIVIVFTIRFLSNEELSIRQIALQYIQQLIEKFKDINLTNQIIKNLIANLNNQPNQNGFQYQMKLVQILLVQNKENNDLIYWDLILNIDEQFLIKISDKKYTYKIQALKMIRQIDNKISLQTKTKFLVLVLITSFELSQELQKGKGFKQSDSEYRNMVQNFKEIFAQVIQNFPLDRIIKLLNNLLNKMYQDKRTIMINMKLVQVILNVVQMWDLLPNQLKKFEQELLLRNRMQKQEENQESKNMNISNQYFFFKKYLQTDLKDDQKKQLVLTEFLISLSKHMDLQTFKSDFFYLMKMQVSMLLSKDQKLRDKVLRSLAGLAIQIGPNLLHFVFRDLKDVLVEPHQKHIRNFAAWFIVNQLHINNKEFQFKNQSLYFLLDFCIEETFTEMFNEKNNEEIKIRSKEIWSHKADQILLIVFQHSNLQEGFLFKAIQQLNNQIFYSKKVQADTQKLIHLYKNIVEGLINNTSVHETNAFQCFDLYYQQNKNLIENFKLNLNQKRTLKNNFEEEQDDQKIDKVSQRKKIGKIQQGASTGEWFKNYLTGNSITKENLKMKLEITFALMFLDQQIEWNVIEAENQQLNQNLGNLIQLKDDFINSLVLKIISKTLQFYQEEEKVEQIIQQIFCVLKQTGVLQTELIENCFKALLNIFQIGIPKLTHTQYEIMFYKLKESGDFFQESQNSFDFLQFLIQIKFIQPQIYDIMETLFEQLFKINRNTQNILYEKLIKVFQLFFINFPLNKKLVEIYSGKLILGIETKKFIQIEGLLMILQSVLNQYGVQFIQETFMFNILQLSTYSINSKDIQTSTQIQEVISLMILIQEKQNKNINNNLLDYSLTFLNNDDFTIRHSGYIIVKVLYQCQNAKATKVISNEAFQQILNKEFQAQSELITLMKKEIQQKIQNALTVQQIKDQKFLVYNLIQLIKQLEKDDSQIKYVQKIQMILNHPNNEVQIQILQYLDQICSNNQIANVLKENPEIFIYLTNLIKKKFFVLNKENYIWVLINYLNISQKNQLPYLDLFMQILEQILRKLLRKVQENIGIIQWIVDIVQILVQQFGQELLLNKHLLTCVAILNENEQINQNEEIWECIENLIQKNIINQSVQSDFFQIQQEILNQRMNRKQKEKMLAIQNPVLFAQKKQAKKRVKNEKNKKKKIQKIISRK